MTDETILLISIIAAIIPTLFFVGLIYLVDRYEKEPWWLLTAAFLWGAIPSIGFAFVFNSLFSIPIYALVEGGAADAIAASLIAPPIEELIKGAALLLILFFWRHELDSPLDGIIYGAMVGMGFAMVENVYYFVNTFAEGGAEAWSLVVFLRGVIFGLNHALFTSATGLGIAVARLSTNSLARVTAPFIGLGAGIFLHFLHNLTVSFGSLFCIVALIADWGGVWLIFFIMLWALAQERSWIKDYLRQDVAAGLLTPEQYAVAASANRRFVVTWGRLFKDGWRKTREARRFYRHCSELAYNRHHYGRFQDEKSATRIQKLRATLAETGDYGVV